jgi:hypothetical protein
MADGSLQHPHIRHLRPITTAEFQHEAVPTQVTLDAELDGWRHNDVRFFAHRVDVLERQLRRRTWTLGSALAFSLVCRRSGNAFDAAVTARSAASADGSLKCLCWQTDAFPRPNRTCALGAARAGQATETAPGSPAL